MDACYRRGSTSRIDAILLEVSRQSVDGSTFHWTRSRLVLPFPLQLGSKAPPSMLERQYAPQASSSTSCTNIYGNVLCNTIL